MFYDLNTYNRIMRSVKKSDLIKQLRAYVNDWPDGDQALTIAEIENTLSLDRWNKGVILSTFFCPGITTDYTIANNIKFLEDPIAYKTLYELTFGGRHDAYIDYDDREWDRHYEININSDEEVLEDLTEYFNSEKDARERFHEIILYRYETYKDLGIEDDMIVTIDSWDSQGAWYGELDRYVYTHEEYLDDRLEIKTAMNSIYSKQDNEEYHALLHQLAERVSSMRKFTEEPEPDQLPEDHQDTCEFIMSDGVCQSLWEDDVQAMEEACIKKMGW